MITFWTDDRGRSHFDRFLSAKADDTYPRIDVARYDDLAPVQVLTAKAHVFSALDQLTQAEVAAVASIRDQLEASAPRVRLLNNPGTVLHRYELLRALAAAGLNAFRAYRPTEDLARVRYPVFIREEWRHTGAWPLLHSRRDLDRAMTAPTARRVRRGGLLIVEFCDTADGFGLYRKYGALKIGDRILPRHMMIGTEWMLKRSGNLRTLEAAREQLAYVKENPHEAWLREVFRIANIDYGRVDYSMLGDTPQVWEINLDPALGGVGGIDDTELGRLRKERREIASRAMSAAWAALDAGPPPGEIRVVLSAPTLRGVRIQKRRRSWRKRARAFGRWCADRPYLGWPFRWTYRRLFHPATVFRMP